MNEKEKVKREKRRNEKRHEKSASERGKRKKNQCRGNEIRAHLLRVTLVYEVDSNDFQLTHGTCFNESEKRREKIVISLCMHDSRCE